MVMKTSSSTSYRPCVTVNKDGSSSTINRIVGYSSLNNVSSVRGDRHSPNPHTYKSVKSLGYQGVIRSLQSTTSGSMPYVFNWETYVTDWDTNTYNAALTDYYNGLRGSMDLSVDLVQWKKTLQMVSLYRRLVNGLAKQAIKLLPKVDRHDKLMRAHGALPRGSVRAKRLLSEAEYLADQIARARLEYVYGWKPMVSNLQTIAKGSLRTRESGLIKIVGRSMSRTRREEVQYSINTAVPVKFFVEKSTRVMITGYYNPAPSLVDNLAQIASLNPLSILYEATPFSFVLDWGWNFSEFLRNYESAFVYKNDFVKGFQTILCRHNVTARMDGFDKVMKTSYNLGGYGTHQTFARTILNSSPRPQRPRFELKLGIDRILNALALAKVVLPRADTIADNRRVFRR